MTQQSVFWHTALLNQKCGTACSKVSTPNSGVAKVASSLSLCPLLSHRHCCLVRGYPSNDGIFLVGDWWEESLAPCEWCHLCKKAGRASHGEQGAANWPL